MMPALRTAEKSIRAVDLLPGDKISAWTVEWTVNQNAMLGALPKAHHVLRGVVEKTTPKSVWVNTGSRVLRFATAGLLARGTWRSARYQGETHGS